MCLKCLHASVEREAGVVSLDFPETATNLSSYMP